MSLPDPRLHARNGKEVTLESQRLVVGGVRQDHRPSNGNQNAHERRMNQGKAEKG